MAEKGIMPIKDEKDRRFIEELYKEYGYIVWKYSLLLTSDKNEADELLHNSFMNVIKYIENVKKANLCKRRNYIFTIVRHTNYKMYKKKEQVKETIERLEVEKYLEDKKNSELEMDNSFERIIEENSPSTLMLVLENMPEKQKIILKLKYRYELDDKEIAKFIGVQANSVRMCKTRALRMLKDRLKGSEYDEEKAK